jgi:hypothetical protein
MSRYRKVHVKIWNDEKFMAFSNEGKLAFLFLLTHPHMTSLGAMRATMGGVGRGNGLGGGAMAAALGPARDAGMVMIDTAAAFLWIPRFLDYNPPESPSVVRSWPLQAEMIPECADKKRVINKARIVCEQMGGPWAEAFQVAFKSGCRTASPPGCGTAWRQGVGHPEPEPEPEPLPKDSKELGAQNAGGTLTPDIKDGTEPGLFSTRGPILEQGLGGAQKKGKAGPLRRFEPPRPEQVNEYAATLGFQLDGQRFVDYYAARGWKYKGGVAMKDWRAAVRTWRRQGGQNGGIESGGGGRVDRPDGEQAEERRKQLRRIGDSVEL